jgi:hypothetical protein
MVPNKKYKYTKLERQHMMKIFTFLKHADY